jgi:excisionase family DNA binding protein
MPNMLIAVSPEELKELIAEAVRGELGNTPKPVAKNWLSTTELADHFHVCGRTVVYWAQKHGCPHYRVGGRWRFVLADVERWHAARVDGRSVPNLGPAKRAAAR